MSFVFCTFFIMMGFELATARGGSASVSDHVMTSKDYIKVEQVRFWLGSFSLAKFQQFLFECFIQVLFSLILTAYKGHLELMFSGAVFSTESFGPG